MGIVIQKSCTVIIAMKTLSFKDSLSCLMMASESLKVMAQPIEKSCRRRSEIQLELVMHQWEHCYMAFATKWDWQKQ